MRKLVIIIFCIMTAGVFLGIRYNSQSRIIAREIGAILWYPVAKCSGAIADPFLRWYTWKSNNNVLNARITILEEAYTNLQAELIKARAVIDMRVRTDEIIAFEQRYAHAQSQLVHIIDRVITPMSHYIFVDAGSKHGITSGMVAIYKNCIVGRVQEIYYWYSKVALITDTSCKIAAFCPRTKATGIHEGCCKETSLINHMSHLQNIAPGDLMLSSGQGTLFPRGFGIGKIISATSSGVLKEVRVQPLINVADIEYCYLISRAEL